MEYLTFNTDLNNFNISCSTSLFKISKINDSVKKMNIIYSIDGDVIEYNLNLFKNIDFCGSPLIVPFYDKAISGSEALKQFWNDNYKELSEINLHKTYNLTIQQMKKLLQNFSSSNLAIKESSIFQMNLIENRLYLDNILDGRELNDKWSIRYQNLIANIVSKNDFINWFKEIDKDIIRKYFDSIPINYELHKEYSKLIVKIINEEQEEDIL